MFVGVMVAKSQEGLHAASSLRTRSRKLLGPEPRCELGPVVVGVPGDVVGALDFDAVVGVVA